jgi:hypothetical protein
MTNNGQKEISGKKSAQRDGRKAMTEYEIQGRATRAKTERLKALRLARDAQVQTDAPPAKRRRVFAPVKEANDGR